MELFMKLEGGERKKRKLSPAEQPEPAAAAPEDDVEEEVKMEKLFALIRSAKHIRDQLIDPRNPTPTSNQKPPPAAAAAATTTAEPAKDQSKSNGNTAGKSDEGNPRADHNNRSNEKHIQDGRRRSRIAIDLNLFPVS